MAYSIFHKYGLDKIKDSLTENFDYKENNPDQWQLVNTKSVMDSDGFMTEYSWYTNGSKHIFMFGDSDLYMPDEDYADWETESEKEASDWFENYNGFGEDDNMSWDMDEEFDTDFQGNSNFMNDGFDRVFGNGTELED